MKVPGPNMPLDCPVVVGLSTGKRVGISGLDTEVGAAAAQLATINVKIKTEYRFMRVGLPMTQILMFDETLSKMKLQLHECQHHSLSCVSSLVTAKFLSE